MVSPPFAILIPGGRSWDPNAGMSCVNPFGSGVGGSLGAVLLIGLTTCPVCVGERDGTSPFVAIGVVPWRGGGYF